MRYNLCEQIDNIYIKHAHQNSKSPFDRVLTQQYLCQKLAKSVDVQCALKL